MIDTVEYWYKALTEVNPSHCTVEHMDDIKSQLGSMRDVSEINREVIMLLVHRNLVDVCATMHLDIVNDLDDQFSKQDKEDLNYGTLMMTSNWAELRWVTKRLKIRSRYTKERAMDIWNHSACKRLNIAMEGNKRRRFREFALLNAYMGLRIAEKCQPRPVAIWAWRVNSCQQLDTLMPEIVERDSNMFMRVMGSCYGAACD